MPKPYGLDDVIAGETNICLGGKDDQNLLYRGYSLDELMQFSTYEEVSYLLLYGQLPTEDELLKFINIIHDNAELPEPLENLLKIMPKNSHIMDVLRTSVSFLGQLENGDDSSLNRGISLFAKIPTIIGSWQMIKNGLPKISASPKLSFAGNILFLITGKVPDETSLIAMEKLLILYAEHEYATSSFVARITTSTNSDLHSSICAGIAALKGELHGGAKEKVMDMLLGLMYGEDTEKWVLNALKEKKLIMGFGHRSYKKGDPRAKIIKECFEDLADKREKTELIEIASIIEETMISEKKLFPNLDFYAAPIYYILDIPVNLFTSIFVASRMVGWISHIIEQSENNRLIKPLSLYTGPEYRKYININER